MTFSLLAVTLLDRIGAGSMLPPIVMYIGPGVAVPVLTGLATVLGLIMLAWDSTVSVVRKVFRRGRPAPPAASSEDETEA